MAILRPCGDIVDFLGQLFSQYDTYTPLLMTLEFIATFCGVVSVILVGRGNILAYPIGLISTALYVYLLWEWQLFGDMMINAYYSIMSIYGWINWSAHKNNDVAIIETTTKKEWFISTWIIIATFIFVGVVYYFKPFINNNFSFDDINLGFHHYTLTDYTDIFTTALFLVAMWLMAKRKIEHWLIWIVADAISIPLYFSKGLFFTSLQYVIFTIIAIISYRSWQQLLKKQSLS